MKSMASEALEGIQYGWGQREAKWGSTNKVSKETELATEARRLRLES